MAITISPSRRSRAAALDERRRAAREVAIERPQIAALDEDVGRAAKDDGAEAVPIAYPVWPPALCGRNVPAERRIYTRVMTLVLGFVLGMATGLRSMTPAAVLAWAAQFRWPSTRSDRRCVHVGADHRLHIDGRRMRGARLRQAADYAEPSPTPGPLGARVVLGGLCAATLSAAVQQSASLALSSEGLGGLAGAWVGYYVRQYSTTRKAPDFLVALIEDAIAIAAALLVVSRV